MGSSYAIGVTEDSTPGLQTDSSLPNPLHHILFPSLDFLGFYNILHKSLRLSWRDLRLYVKDISEWELRMLQTDYFTLNWTINYKIRLDATH